MFSTHFSYSKRGNFEVDIQKDSTDPHYYWIHLKKTKMQQYIKVIEYILLLTTKIKVTSDKINF